MISNKDELLKKINSFFAYDPDPINRINNARRLLAVDSKTKRSERKEPMCDQVTQEAVTNVVKELVAQRVAFTGYDVFKRMHNKNIKRAEDYTGNQEPPKGVSNFVRQLFNSGDPAFADYGSMIVPGNNGTPGPVMFFALPFSAKVRAKAISASLANQPALPMPPTDDND